MLVAKKAVAKRLAIGGKRAEAMRTLPMRRKRKHCSLLFCSYHGRNVLLSVIAWSSKSTVKFEDECYGCSLSGGGARVFPILMTCVVEGVTYGTSTYSKAE